MQAFVLRFYKFIISHIISCENKSGTLDQYLQELQLYRNVPHMFFHKRKVLKYGKCQITEVNSLYLYSGFQYYATDV